MKKIAWGMVLGICALLSSPHEVVIDVKGMTCPLCTTAIKHSLKKTSGVLSTRVSLSKKTALVRYDDNQTDTSVLLEAIRRAGYTGVIRKEKP